MQPIISFVMAVYNNPRYVGNAVNSILSQANEKVELILVDDGSTDNTPQILDDIANLNDNVKVVHQTNQWIYASFNNGTKAAEGKYIYIVNSDDKIYDGTIDLLLKKIEEYDYPDVIWTNVVACKCDGNQNVISSNNNIVRNRVKEENYFSCADEVQKAWPYFVSSGLASNQANLYKKELVLNHPFRNDIYGADYIFNIDICDEVNTAVVLREMVYQFMDYDSCTMNASIGKYYGYEHEMYNEIFYRYLEQYRKWGLDNQLYQEDLFRTRKHFITAEIKILNADNCKMTANEKIKHIFNVVSDCQLMMHLGDENREEIESRILSGTRELLLKEPLLETDDMYFAYEMLNSLLRYEKDISDYGKIERGVFHPYNPNHIGKFFYDKLTENRKMGMKNASDGNEK